MLGSGKISKAGVQVDRSRIDRLKRLYRWWWHTDYANYRAAKAVRDTTVLRGKLWQNGNERWTIGGFVPY